jgi:hypothetical protein
MLFTHSETSLRAPIDWIAVTLLIGLIGPPRIAAHAVASLRVPGSRKPERVPPAIAQQSPIDIRGDDVQVERTNPPHEESARCA